MKKFFTKVGLIFLILIAVQVVLFVLIIFLAMTDARPVPFLRHFYWLFQNVLGFPLVLVNERFPYFLDAPKAPLFLFPLILLNTFLQAGLIFCGIRLWKLMVRRF